MVKTEFDEWLEMNPIFNNLHISIDDGDMFDGSLSQFRDCHFDNAYPWAIFDWANGLGYKCAVTLDIGD